jgi:hypothetical protein
MHKRTKQILQLLLICPLSLTGLAKSATMELLSDGSVTCGSLKMKVIHYNKSWHDTNLIAKTLLNPELKKDGQQTTLTGDFKLSSGNKFVINESLTAISSDNWNYQASLSSKTAIFCNDLALYFQLKTKDYLKQHIFINGKPLELPSEIIIPGGGSIWNGKAKSLKIPMESHTLILTGNFDLRVQDNRKYLGDAYAIRIRFSPYQGQIQKSTLNFTAALKPIQSKPIDISSACNMAFTDKIADDQKGGWTDQGPANDLSTFPTQPQTIKGIRFNPVNPLKNNNKSCLQFAGPSRSYFLPSATIQLTEPLTEECLYLFHASAWTPKAGEKIGTIKLSQDNKSIFQTDIISGEDVGNWWSPEDLKNGKVIWRKSSESCPVGIYMSRFELPQKAFNKVEFIPTRKAVWGVAGVSVGDYVPIASSARKKKMAANHQWQAFDHDMKTVPESIMDLSYMNDAPAGKYGRILINQNNFVFSKRPDVPVRFFGANLCFQNNFLKKEDSEVFAAELARQGYNCIRLHHFDGMLAKGDGNGGILFNKERQDRIDYLFACLKKHGIYITIDLFISRKNKEGDIDGLDFNFTQGFKALYPINQKVRENFKTFARQFLNHVNPYTGLALKDDPALISICPINENYLYIAWIRNPKIQKMYLAEFRKWCKTNNVENTVASESNKEFCRFINQLQLKMTTDLIHFLKDEMKVKTPLSDLNHGNDICQIPVRSTLDYVDNHTYWDHPSFPEKRWKLPFKFHDHNIIKSLAHVPRHIMSTRLFGNPFTVTEFNYNFSNHSRGAGNMIMGAYAALQNWNGLVCFDARYDKKRIPSSCFSILADPIPFLCNRIIALLFRRGDVQKAQNSFAYLFTDKDSSIRTNYPAALTKLGLVSRIGSIDTTKQAIMLPENCKATFGVHKPDNVSTPFFKISKTLASELTNSGIVKEGKYDIKNSNFTSDTNELFIDGVKNSFKVISPKTEGFAIDGNKNAGGKYVNATVLTGNPAVIFVSSMDGKIITESHHLLVLHMTDITNTGMEYKNSQSAIVTNWGKTPLLLQKGKATVSISFSKLLQSNVWALSPGGKRLKEITSANNQQRLQFEANTALCKAGVMAYEIIRKQED